MFNVGFIEKRENRILVMNPRMNYLPCNYY